MPQPYYADQVFKGIDFTNEEFEMADYEFCRFINCQFPKVNISECVFIECEFEGCDISMANLAGTAFRDVKFTECKLMGLQFDQCNAFGFSVKFNSCNLNLSSFFQVKMAGTELINCSLQEVDFSRAVLSKATFDNCDLLRVVFDGTKLLKADFRSAYNFIIDPESNQIQGAKFALQGLPGLLQKYGIVVE